MCIMYHDIIDSFATQYEIKSVIPISYGRTASKQSECCSVSWKEREESRCTLHILSVDTFSYPSDVKWSKMRSTYAKKKKKTRAR